MLPLNKITNVSEGSGVPYNSNISKNPKHGICEERIAEPPEGSNNESHGGWMIFCG